MLVFIGKMALVVGGFRLRFMESRVPLFNEGADGFEAALGVYIQQELEGGDVVVAQPVHVC